MTENIGKQNQKLNIHYNDLKVNIFTIVLKGHLHVKNIWNVNQRVERM